ncbi:aminopeptidase N-like [Stegostoma tigrinum]|uniref:aminopeptidase N-like n=1 Tax=Stegostoma tigrinum TaxID=3053191 RepID=UPI00286FE508|nr:aminopeptidase N-like [Stegostoma tigrinum]
MVTPRNLTLSTISTSATWIQTMRSYLNLTKVPWMIRKQDALATIALVAQNINGKKPAWVFVKDNWESILSEHRSVEAIVGLLEGVTSRFATEVDLQELKAFDAKMESEGLYFASRMLSKAIRRTASYIQWRKENEKAIYNWMRNNV